MMNSVIFPPELWTVDVPISFPQIEIIPAILFICFNANNYQMQTKILQWCCLHLLQLLLEPIEQGMVSII